MNRHLPILVSLENPWPHGLEGMHKAILGLIMPVPGGPTDHSWFFECSPALHLYMCKPPTAISSHMQHLGYTGSNFPLNSFKKIISQSCMLKYNSNEDLPARIKYTTRTISQPRHPSVTIHCSVFSVGGPTLLTIIFTVLMPPNKANIPSKGLIFFPHLFT